MKKYNVLLLLVSFCISFVYGMEQQQSQIKMSSQSMEQIPKLSLFSARTHTTSASSPELQKYKPFDPANPPTQTTSPRRVFSPVAKENPEPKEDEQNDGIELFTHVPLPFAPENMQKPKSICMGSARGKKKEIIALELYSHYYPGHITHTVQTSEQNHSVTTTTNTTISTPVTMQPPITKNSPYCSCVYCCENSSCCVGHTRGFCFYDCCPCGDQCKTDCEKCLESDLN
ncbi:MAG: hypothetical protein UU47_C0003G0045 [candidate division TM6 bacterium GW2011_GWE2_41_16]|nr:MAG: hypothetical protein UU47_C0003G0045 [candidate division TM6 bacterium GW2011_GWE2_41_16]